MRWVCQNNLGSTEDVEAIGRACKEHGHDFVPMQVVPFSDELPDVSTDEPTVFYGAVRWIGKIHESGRWEPGVFFNDNFDYIVCRDAYGEHFLNSDCEVTTLKAISEEDEDAFFFVRPVADDKSFSGAVVGTREMRSWVRKLMAGDCDLYSVPVIKSSPKLLSHEWRLFMVRNRVASGSIYKRFGVLYTKDPVSREVVEFAERMAHRFSPDRVFAVDVCCEEGGDLKVLEVGCFNSAGFYDSDIARIVEEVSGIG